ncbi:MAG: flagellar hook-basal body complex protein FliE [Bacteroidetes bacterium]|jgi:flagellar hook-basal body complex protein FliE|nr:flagellar hook-basal body complex protein FliE [Bacteroidota bacterium]
MKVSQALTLLPNVEQTVNTKAVDKALQQTNDSFGAMLNKAIGDVNSLQSEASKAVESLVTGEAQDLHEVMIAVEKARTSFDLLMEIRNKTVDMYREIMRTQV